jgi:hypothetical protein
MLKISISTDKKFCPMIFLKELPKFVIGHLGDVAMAHVTVCGGVLRNLSFRRENIIVE